MIVGSGEFQHRVNADWAKLPDGWSFQTWMFARCIARCTVAGG
jgi:hypothetical protein